MSVFNSSNKIAGYYQALSGGKATVKIARATNASSPAESGEGIGAGFLIQGYTINFERNVTLQHFLNIQDSVAIVGLGQGMCRLNGLVGKLEDFEKLIVGGDDKNAEDICNQLIVTIEDQSTFNKCTNEAASEVKTTRKIICSGGVVRGIQLGGTLNEGGILLQSGTLSIQFTSLDFDKSV